MIGHPKAWQLLVLLGETNMIRAAANAHSILTAIFLSFISLLLTESAFASTFQYSLHSGSQSGVGLLFVEGLGGFDFDYATISDADHMTLIYDDGGTTGNFVDDVVTISGVMFNPGTGILNEGLYRIQMTYDDFGSAGPEGAPLLTNLGFGTLSSINTAVVTNFNLVGKGMPYSLVFTERVPTIADPYAYLGEGWLEITNGGAPFTGLDLDFHFYAERTTSEVPEPSTYMLLGLGLLGLMRMRCKKA